MTSILITDFLPPLQQNICQERDVIDGLTFFRFWDICLKLLPDADVADEDEDEEEDEEDLELDRSATFGGQNNYNPVHSRRSTGSGSGKSRSTNLRVSHPDMDNLRPGQIIKTREFWILWMTFFLNTQPIGYINSMYKVKRLLLAITV